MVLKPRSRREGRAVFPEHRTTKAERPRAFRTLSAEPVPAGSGC